jgi:hypothetical protein
LRKEKPLRVYSISWNSRVLESWIGCKAARTNTVIATKALACKLAKAAWHLMAEKTDYDEKRIFPQECGRAALSQRKGLVKNPGD